MTKQHFEGAATELAYHGYILRPSLTGDVWFVQKGGFTIATCTTLEAARKAVDEVTA